MTNAYYQLVHLTKTTNDMNYWIIPGRPKINIKEAIKETLIKLGLNSNVFFGNDGSRSRAYSRCRDIIAYILRTRHNHTFVSIGKLLKRHHSSVIYQNNMAKYRIENYDDYKEDYKVISKYFT